MMAMSYGYVYVAQVAMGADPNQTLKAIREAEAYNGPSIVICYCPCIEHGMKCGMGSAKPKKRKPSKLVTGSSTATIRKKSERKKMPSPSIRKHQKAISGPSSWARTAMLP